MNLKRKLKPCILESRRRADSPCSWCLKKCPALFEKTKNNWTNRGESEIKGNRIIQEKWPFFRVTYTSRCIRTTFKKGGLRIKEKIVWLLKKTNIRGSNFFLKISISNFILKKCKFQCWQNNMNFCKRWTAFINSKEVQGLIMVNKSNFCNRSRISSMF